MQGSIGSLWGSTSSPLGHANTAVGMVGSGSIQNSLTSYPQSVVLSQPMSTTGRDPRASDLHWNPGQAGGRGGPAQHPHLGHNGGQQGQGQGQGPTVAQSPSGSSSYTTAAWPGGAGGSGGDATQGGEGLGAQEVPAAAAQPQGSLRWVGGGDLQRSCMRTACDLHG